MKRTSMLLLILAHLVAVTSSASAVVYYWTNDDADGDFENGTTGNNWRTAAGVAAGKGVYPGSAQTDSIVFPSWAAGAPDTNMDQSANANGIEDLTVEDGYAYAIGTREAPLYLKTAATPIWTFEGDDHGGIYIISATGTISEVRVTKTASAADSSVHLVFVTAAATLAKVTGGNVVFESGLFGQTSLGVATMHVAKQTNASAPNVTLAAPVTTVLNNRGGTIDWLSGTLTALDHYSGTFRCEKSAAARTLTASAIYGGIIDFRTGVPGTITLTAAIAYYGGAILWDVGESLQRS